MCEFVPVKFTNYYNCVLNVQIEATMLDLKFRANNEVKNIAECLFTDSRSGKVPINLDLWYVE